MPVSQEARQRAIDPCAAQLLAMIDPEDFPIECIPSTGTIGGKRAMLLTFRIPGTTFTAVTTPEQVKRWLIEIQGVLDTITESGLIVGSGQGPATGGLVRDPYAH